MSKLKNPITVETTFATYLLDEVIGEGGAGRVYGGTSDDQSQVAVKVLTSDRASQDKRKRFKNEIEFLSRTTHANLVKVLDRGVVQTRSVRGPFYVMRRYPSSLRGLMRTGIARDKVLKLFIMILDGVEAAHLNGVVHRDLKPENILCDDTGDTLAVADFGIARFSADLLATSVETSPAQRLANFQYAAPEQRVPGSNVTATADVYALGLILNEMFTGSVPHGTAYRRISDVAADFGFLDPIADRMLRQAPSERPQSIAELKGLIQRYSSEAIVAQRLSEISNVVVKADEVDDPLALDPPQLIDFDWDRNNLTLILDRPVTPNWVHGLRNMGGHSAVFGKGPETFQFSGNKAHVSCEPHEVQPIINHFKSWLPNASRALKRLLEQEAERRAFEERKRLEQERLAEDTRLKVLRTVKI